MAKGEEGGVNFLSQQGQGRGGGGKGVCGLEES